MAQKADNEQADKEVDVVVVGMGVGGEEVAERLAEAGLAVVGVEERLVGGECPYYACVPTKMMVRSAGMLAEARRIDGMAGHADVHADWTPVARRIRDEATDNWDDRVAVERFTGKGGQFVRGRGRLAGPGRVVVSTSDGDRAFRASRAVVIATGSAPAAPPVDGLAGTPYWTNREAVQTTEVPASLLMLGGGPVGLELAQVFARFGSAVTVVEALPRVMAALEPEASALVQRALGADGVQFHTSATVTRVQHDSLPRRTAGFRLTIEDGPELAADQLLVATGRRTDLPDLGIDTVGLDPQARTIPTDERLRAGERLWAVGDVTGHGAFTHVAMYQAGIVVRDILGEPGPPADYRALPNVTFTDPEIGVVGLTEQAATDAGIRVATGYTELPSATRGWIHKAGNDGFIKLVADADRGTLVGATSAGPTGGEVLYGLAVAVHGEVPVTQLQHMIHAYPTFHRAVEAALRTLG